MTASPALVAITMLARSGATALAWARFQAGRFADDDPAALTVKGRLLKDRARASSGAAARALFGEAAAAYTAAATLDGTTYPLINAATLTLLAGDAGGAGRIAAQVLALQDSGAPDSETPYYRAATRAEALLLLGRRVDAEAALVAAIALAPDAPEDHATTLRQFALIAAATGDDAAWLDALRPGSILQFSGRMAAATAAPRPAEIAAILAAERVRHAFGALGAGADVLIAEAVIAHGAALHVVLPAPVADFMAVSVAPFGADWTARANAVLAAAASIDTEPGGPITPAAIDLAGERAMGRAILLAQRHAAAAVQLQITGDGDGGHSARQASLWQAGGRQQHRLVWPGEAAIAAPISAGPPQQLAAVIEVMADAPPALLAGIAQAIAALPPPLSAAATPAGARLAWPDPVLAARAATAIMAAADPGHGVHIAGHYAVVAAAPDPFTGHAALYGPAFARAARLAALVPAGAIYVTDDFLAGLVLRSPDFSQEFVGEAPGERGTDALPLYAISARGNQA
jgi:hypothetical protein